VRAWLVDHGVELYVLVLAGASVAGLAMSPLPSDIASWLPTFALLTVLSTILEFVAIPLARGGVLSVATITHVASLLVLPPTLAAMSIGAAVIIEETINRTRPAKAIFNTASFVLTALVASHAAARVGSLWTDAAAGSRDHIAVFGAIALAGGLYYVLNACFLASVLRIATGERFLRLLRVNTRDTGLSELGAGTLGGFVALIWVVEPLWMPMLAVPAAVIGRSLIHIRRLQSETTAAVRSLADLVDHRDSSTYHHSERVAAYASALGREMELDDELLELIDLAASVHDLGKIGVPDRILLKPGPLDPAEQIAMWRHTLIGEAVLAHYQLFRKGSLIVRHHHEAYDGTGYPDGLAGEQIPLGARVVSVADSFDAMTSDRPYRAALSTDEAVRRLRAGAGTQWDPLVVGYFLRLVLEGRLPQPDGMHVAVTDSSVLDGPVPTVSRDSLRDPDHPTTVAGVERA
jgi:HD-GYP domain-containing protein (c-di-GMP phosphodiesterase class II)